MSDTDSKPDEDRQKEIFHRIETYEHDVLKTSEVAAGISVGPKQAGRDLRAMHRHDLIGARQLGDDGGTWLWWNPEDLSTDESVIQAQKVRSLLRELYDNRWEFRLMAIGAGLVMIVFSLTFWLVVLREFGFYQLSGTSILALMGTGLLLAILTVFTALFIFPYETAGSWQAATEADEDEKSD